MRYPKALPFVAFRWSDGSLTLCYSRRRVKPARERMRRIAEVARDLAVPQTDVGEQASVTVQYGPGERESWPICEKTALEIYRRVSELMMEDRK